MIGERVVLCGIEHFEQGGRGVAAEIPRTSLSISSSIITGLLLPALRSSAMIRPGIEPMYVRRCPRMSASSRTPPRATRMNLRPIDSAILLPRLVLPTPGGPTKQRIAGEFCTLDRLILSFNTARYSMIRRLTLSKS